MALWKINFRTDAHTAKIKKYYIHGLFSLVIPLFIFFY